MPKLDAEWIQLNNADVEGWEGYRERSDPVQMREWLHHPSEQIRQISVVSNTAGGKKSVACRSTGLDYSSTRSGAP